MSDTTRVQHQNTSNLISVCASTKLANNASLLVNI